MIKSSSHIVLIEIGSIDEVNSSLDETVKLIKSVGFVFNVLWCDSKEKVNDPIAKLNCIGVTNFEIVKFPTLERDEFYNDQNFIVDFCQHFEDISRVYYFGRNYEVANSLKELGGHYYRIDKNNRLIDMLPLLFNIDLSSSSTTTISTATPISPRSSTVSYTNNVPIQQQTIVNTNLNIQQPQNNPFIQPNNNPFQPQQSLQLPIQQQQLSQSPIIVNNNPFQQLQPQQTLQQQQQPLFMNTTLNNNPIAQPIIVNNNNPFQQPQQALQQQSMLSPNIQSQSQYISHQPLIHQQPINTNINNNIIQQQQLPIMHQPIPVNQIYNQHHSPIQQQELIIPIQQQQLFPSIHSPIQQQQQELIIPIQQQQPQIILNTNMIQHEQVSINKESISERQSILSQATHRFLGLHEFEGMSTSVTISNSLLIICVSFGNLIEQVVPIIDNIIVAYRLNPIWDRARSIVYLEIRDLVNIIKFLQCIDQDARDYSDLLGNNFESAMARYHNELVGIISLSLFLDEFMIHCKDKNLEPFKEELSQYIKERESRLKMESGILNFMVKPHQLGATKISASRKLLSHLSTTYNVKMKLTEAELESLNDGHLGELVKKYQRFMPSTRSLREGE